MLPYYYKLKMHQPTIMFEVLVLLSTNPESKTCILEHSFSHRTGSFFQMAAAGFFHCPTDQEPDLVRCFVCHKELDGWEPTDDPWYVE
jgi:Inhibitor of Apoptosis domain